jgi:hypothetical protein
VKEIWDEVCQEADERVELTERMGSMVHSQSPFPFWAISSADMSHLRYRSTGLMATAA